MKGMFSGNFVDNVSSSLERVTSGSRQDEERLGEKPPSSVPGMSEMSRSQGGMTHGSDHKKYSQSYSLPPKINYVRPPLTQENWVGPTVNDGQDKSWNSPSTTEEQSWSAQSIKLTSEQQEWMTSSLTSDPILNDVPVTTSHSRSSQRHSSHSHHDSDIGKHGSSNHLDFPTENKRATSPNVSQPRSNSSLSLNHNTEHSRNGTPRHSFSHSAEHSRSGTPRSSYDDSLKTDDAKHTSTSTTANTHSSQRHVSEKRSRLESMHSASSHDNSHSSNGKTIAAISNKQGQTPALTADGWASLDQTIQLVVSTCQALWQQLEEERQTRELLQQQLQQQGNVITTLTNELLQIQEQQSEILHEVHQARTSGLWPGRSVGAAGRTLRLDSHQSMFGRHSPQPQSLLHSHAHNSNLNMSHSNLSSQLSILPPSSQSSHLGVLQSHSAPLSPLGGLGTTHSHSRSVSPHSSLTGPHSLPVSHSLLLPSHSSAGSQSYLSSLSTPLSHHQSLGSHHLTSTSTSSNPGLLSASMYSQHNVSPNSLLLSQTSLSHGSGDILDQWDGSVAHKIRAALTPSQSSNLLMQARHSPSVTPSRDVRSATLKLAALRTRETDKLYAAHNQGVESDASILELLNNFQLGKT